MVGDAVGDAAHRVLADAEPQVAARVCGLEVVVAEGLDVGQVGLGEVRGAAEQLRHRPRERLDQVLARVAGRDFGAGLVDVEPGVPASARRPASAGAARPPRPGMRRVGVRTASQSATAPARATAHGTARRPRRGRRTSCPGPSRRPPWSGGPRRGRAGRRAPSACPALLGLPKPMWVRTAMSDGRSSALAASMAALIAATSLPSSTVGVPAVRIKAREDVLGEGQRGRSVELDAVVVVRAISLPSLRWPASDAASDAMPSWMSPSEQMA